MPLYQRTYSWSTEQLQRLWDDILEQAALVEEGASEITHFLGSVVLAPSPHDEPVFRRWLVVDGQQRLTTLSLALAAIRDHARESDVRQSERINELFLINKFSDGDDFLRFLPTQADREAYSDCIRAGRSGEHTNPISAAYVFFRQQLIQADDPNDPHDITRIEQAIAGRLSLVVIAAGRDDNVHRIFESLNNTGLQLSQADLLRNYLFMRMPGREERVYRSHWLPLQNSLSNDDLEQLMWLQLVLDSDMRVTRRNLYTAQQQRLAADRANADDIEKFIVELHDRAILFRRILQPETETNPEIRQYLQRLNVWGATITQPVVLMLMEKRDRGEIDDHEVVVALSYVESLLVRRAICALPSNSLGKAFQTVPASMPADSSVADGIRRVLSARSNFWPTDRELADAIRNKPFYRARGNQRRLILQRLEESHGHTEPINFTNLDLTVEHVLPQNPGKFKQDWLDPMESECAEGESVTELHARLIHTLGNLTLSGSNSQLSNHPFDRKQELLSKSHLEMNRSIAAAPRWGAAEIWERAADLTKRACDIWPSPIENLDYALRGPNWTLLRQTLMALPHGAWTTYGALAALLGLPGGAQPVGNYLANNPVVNAHRVLKNNGSVSKGFRWMDSADQRDVVELLTGEGVRFDTNGLADQSQSLDADALAALTTDD